MLIAIGPDASFSRANEARTPGARGWVSIVIISFLLLCIIVCFLLSVIISHRYGHWTLNYYIIISILLFFEILHYYYYYSPLILSIIIVTMIVP